MTIASSADTLELPAADDIFAKHFGPSPPPVRVTFGAESHPGLVRSNNEDHYLVIERRRSRSVLLTNLPPGYLAHADDTGYVFAVADGIGGAAFGELASMLALRSAWEQGAGAIKWTWIVNDREIEELKERVEIVFRRINEALANEAKRQPQLAGMGTTLTGAYTVGPEAFIAHVGDSRAYLYHEGRLTQLTRDHTLAQKCLEAGLPVPCRSWQHVLTNCLGGAGPDVHVDFHHLRLADGDGLLLCTDGLSDLVRDEEIAAILGQHAEPQEAVRALVAVALDRGGKDNVTVVLARYDLKGPEGHRARATGAETIDTENSGAACPVHVPGQALLQGAILGVAGGLATGSLCAAVLPMLGAEVHLATNVILTTCVAGLAGGLCGLLLGLAGIALSGIGRNVALTAPVLALAGAAGAALQGVDSVGWVAAGALGAGSGLCVGALLGAIRPNVARTLSSIGLKHSRCGS